MATITKKKLIGQYLNRIKQLQLTNQIQLPVLAITYLNLIQEQLNGEILFDISEILPIIQNKKHEKT